MHRAPWTRPIVALVDAGVAHARGDRDAAIRHLRSALDSAELADMLLYANVARMRLGGLLGGDEGERLLFEAREWMAGQGVREGARFAAMFAPGIE